MAVARRTGAGADSAVPRRIGVDFHAVDGKHQGSRTHLIELFRRVFRLLPAVDFLLFLDGAARVRDLGEEFTASNVRAIRMPLRNPVARLGWQLPRLELRHRLDLLHVQYVAPLWNRSRVVVTIHDVLFESHPGFFPPFFRLRSRWLVRRTARRAAQVFTVSEFSRAEIAARYGVPEDRLTVLHNAVDRGRFHPGGGGESIVERRGLRTGGYILSVGRLEPRKNIAALLQAYARLPATGLPLVVAGARDFGFRSLFDLAASLGIAARVRFMEDVADAELPALYRHARLFVFPSFAEGFGLPPLEAMASGVPVISSATTALPEVVGDAALRCDPDDIASLAAGMERLLADPRLAAELASKGLARAHLFQWETAARRVAATYARLLSVPMLESFEPGDGGRPRT